MKILDKKLLEEDKSQVVHAWPGLKERKLDISMSDDTLNGSRLKKIVEVLKHLNPNEYMVVKEINSKDNTITFQKTLDEIREYGLDVGREDCEYGDKMPPPKKGESTRKLIIFRRK